MYKVVLKLDKFFLKYEGEVKLTPPQEKIPAKSPALLGLIFVVIKAKTQFGQFFINFMHNMHKRITRSLYNNPNKDPEQD